MKSCPYCAESIDDAAVYCQYCGHDTGKPPTPPTQRFAPAPERPVHEPSRSAAPVVAVLLVLAVVVGGVWLAVDGKNLPSQQASDIQASNAATNVSLADPPTPIPTPSPIPARDFVVALDGWKCSTTQQGQTSFVGQVRNYGRQPIGMVELRVTLLDGQNHEVNSEVGRVNLPTCLKQDETTQFIVRLSNPNFTGKRCRVETERATFATLGSSNCPSGDSPASNATAPAGSASSTTGGSLLSTLTRIRKNIQALAQDSETVHCERNLPDSVLNNYEVVTNAPKFSVSAATQAAYNDYRAAVDIITRTNKDMYLHCSAWVNGTATTNVVPRQTWGTARQGVDQALQSIDAGIAKLK